MVRNITSLKATSGRNLFRVKGAEYSVPREVAVVVAQSLYGSKVVPSDSSVSKVQSVLNRAYDDKVFSFKVNVIGE